jgi:3-oxoacyl-(acyl-carrier-protein) synthase
VSRIYVSGLGAVSPAGWGVAPLRDALAKGVPIPTQGLARPGWKRGLTVRQVPAPTTRPAWFAHPRLRRSSPVSQYAVATALEALGEDAAKTGYASFRLGVIQCVMSGCVNYSRRFYDEVLRHPGTASPLLFPETVFNAPSSHLAAVLETTAINYTLIGDPGIFLQGLALGAQWLVKGLADACLVVGAEEMDWLTADAFRLFSRGVIVSEGAGALYLSKQPCLGRAIALDAVTDAFIFFDRPTRERAARGVAKQLVMADEGGLLCDGRCGVASMDQPEWNAWREWQGQRISVKELLGEGLVAASAWQCVAAVDAIQRGETDLALVNVVGCNQQAIGARFVRHHAT